MWSLSLGRGDHVNAVLTTAKQKVACDVSDRDGAMEVVQSGVGQSRLQRGGSRRPSRGRGSWQRKREGVWGTAT